MIPPVIGSETASPVEKELFARLRDEVGTADWTVIHSLDIAQHRVNISGECDFLIAVPSLGVLALEVKSHRSVSRDASGMWHLGGDPPTRTGPFRQSSEAMHSIRNEVARRSPGLKGVLFWSAVCFTNSTFSLSSPAEWHEWQVIDQVDLQSKALSELIKSVLIQARNFVASKSIGWFRPDSGEPTAEQIDSLVKILRPSVECFESPKARRRQRDGELIRYTEEQYEALDNMNPSRNQRVVFMGPAGTGKTLLALEEARRSALREERVLLCCFNRLLGDWLRNEAEPLKPFVTAGSIDAIMLELAGTEVPSGAGPSFWRETLPTLALEKVLDGGPGCEPFDVLLVDEAQDFLHEGYLDLLDSLLLGGLKQGRWRFFGDFERQSIYGSSVSLDETLNRIAPGTPQFELRRNCRNPPRIAAFVGYMSGLDHGYSKVLRPDSGVEPSIIYFDTPEAQVQELVQLFRSLEGMGYRGGEIVVLSPKASGCAAEQVREAPWSDRLKRARAVSQGGIRYSTIHAFKGLESPVVIVTDVVSIGTERDQSLLYVAATRAVERLYLLASTQLRPLIAEIFLNPKTGGAG